MTHNYYRTPWKSNNYTSSYSSTYSSSYRPPYMLSNSSGSVKSSYLPVTSSLPSYRASPNSYSSSYSTNTIPRSMGQTFSKLDWNSVSKSFYINYYVNWRSLSIISKYLVYKLYNKRKSISEKKKEKKRSCRIPTI